MKDVVYFVSFRGDCSFILVQVSQSEVGNVKF